ncbi:MAG: hypothetical protein Q8O34_00315 [Rhodocyclaceae bacterium]|nr:hypothetical protein [Rhodocyclaceae bacterium]
MSTVDALEHEVQNLPSADFAKFRSWFIGFDAAIWDSQIESDAADGKLNAFAEEAFAEYRAGRVCEL